MPGGAVRERKEAYFTRLLSLLDEYTKIFIVNADNVGSLQMQQIRLALRGRGVLLMGKNTMMRKAIRGHVEAGNDQFASLLPFIKGNMGFVFTNDDLIEVRDVLLSNKVAAPARAGAIAQCDVAVPAGVTGMDPSKTSFFQALAIPTKIARGQIEIVNDVSLIKKGERVGPSEAALLQMLKVLPFSYGLVVSQVYDNGNCYSAEVLELTDAVLLQRFAAGLRNVASLSLAIGYPTAASAPHSLVKGLKNIIAVAVAADIDIPLAETAKAFLADPSAFAAAAPAAAAGAPAAAAAKAPEPEPEESEEEVGFGLFD